MQGVATDDDATTAMTGDGEGPDSQRIAADTLTAPCRRFRPLWRPHGGETMAFWRHHSSIGSEDETIRDWTARKKQKVRLRVSSIRRRKRCKKERVGYTR